MRKELPLKHIEEPELLSNEGLESEVFTFKPEKGKKYIYKETKSSIKLHLYKGKSLEEKASGMKKVYDVLKKHYRDKIVDTHFIIGKNIKDEPCLIKIQEKVEGILLGDLNKDDVRYKKALRQQQEMLVKMNKVSEEILKAPGLQDYSLGTSRAMITDIDNSSNIIVNKNGDATIIDW